MHDPSTADRVRDLVAACVERLERGQPDPVASVCAEAPELTARVRERLARLRGMGLLGQPATDTLESFGPYRILEKLGAGGMGTVWLAEQAEPVQRRVALKVVKLGMDSAEVLARFDAERQALARLSHPHVARIFDAGVVPGGRPFFAMELVEGTPIHAYADAKGLDTDGRLRLLLPVCDAVQHAHQRGLIHRDLKPSNILVAERDGAPAPVVIDFGVAKALDATGISKELRTEHGKVLGTPEYMSPEQAGESSTDVDTRTDVYALGVVLYELLTGTLPHDGGTTPGGHLRQLTDVDPPTPSSRVSTLANGNAIAGQRCTTQLALRRRLRGDLDWITLNAIARARNDRYASVSALADDLRRHLAGEPVAAAPPSRAYLLRKTIRRHRVAFAAIATVVLGMAIALVGIAFGLGEARAQTRVAENLFHEALSAVDQLLVRASQLRLADVPRATEIEVEFRGDALAALESLLEQRPNDVDLRARVARASFELADGLYLLRRTDACRTFAHRARRELLALDEAGVAGTDVLEVLGRTHRLLFDLELEERADEAARSSGLLALDVFRKLREQSPEEPKYQALHASMLVRYGGLFAYRGDSETYAQYLDQALALREDLVDRYPGDDAHHMSLMQSLQLAGMHHRFHGDLATAADATARAVELAAALAARDPTRVKRRALGIVTSFAGLVDADLGDVEQAEAKWRRARAILGQLGEDFPDVVEIHHELAQPSYYLASSLADRWEHEPQLVTEVADLMRGAVASNRRALLRRPDERKFAGWHRTLLQLLEIALRCLDDPPEPEIAAVHEELRGLARTADHARELERHLGNARALQRARESGR